MRYSVLTYIFNGYEIVQEIEEKDPEAEYILVTDDPSLKSDTWTIILDQSRGRSPFHTDIVLRVDGSIKILKSLKPLIDKFENGKYDRCLMIHPRRNTLPEEYDIWCRFRRYPRSQARRSKTALPTFGASRNF